MDLAEIREVSGVIQHLGISDDAVCIDYECGTLGHAFHIEDPLFIQASVGAGNLFVEITQQGEIKLFRLFEFGQREYGIHRDAQYGSLGIFVLAHVVAGRTYLLGADAGEGLREEHQYDVFPFEFAEGNFVFTGVVQGKIRSGLTYLQ